MTEPDNRVEVEIELEEDIQFALMKIAHERDITLNQLIEQLIREAMDNAEDENNRIYNRPDPT
jgi:predicted DNA-binding ribbon-helix-helix protein